MSLAKRLGKSILIAGLVGFFGWFVTVVFGGNQSISSLNWVLAVGVFYYEFMIRENTMPVVRSGRR